MGNATRNDTAIGLFASLSHIRHKRITLMVGVALIRTIRGENADFNRENRSARRANNRAHAKDRENAAVTLFIVPPREAKNILFLNRDINSLPTSAGSGATISLFVFFANTHQTATKAATDAIGKTISAILFFMSALIFVRHAETGHAETSKYKPIRR